MNPQVKVLLQRPQALLNVFVRGLDPKSISCPSCGGDPLPGRLDRRFGVLSLRRCGDCRLLYRTPTDTPIQSTSFYQENYVEETVTELPDPAQLAELKADGFSIKGDLSQYISLMKRFHDEGPARLLDYGCSWGYNTWRFQQQGFTASGVEVSRPRCDYGKRELGVDAHYSADGLAPDFDVFYSSHVFEHVPSPAKSFEEACRLLANKGGLCIIITPNGCDAFRKKRQQRWHQLWGRKHPNFLDDEFWEHQLGNIPHVLMSRSEDGSVIAPLGKISPETIGAGRKYDLSGEELILIASIPKS
jgi:SAM-dependent methyltransferase